MLKGKQKRFLRAQAHHLSPIFQVGKGGVNDNMVKQISEALEARELLKVSVLQNCDEDKTEVAKALVKGAKAGDKNVRIKISSVGNRFAIGEVVSS